MLSGTKRNITQSFEWSQSSLENRNPISSSGPKQTGNPQRRNTPDSDFFRNALTLHTPKLSRIIY
ncbi:hypothetical protein Hanom_Chr08g00717941 [Helianthus anomalus]